jgi:hypothetical protein
VVIFAYRLFALNAEIRYTGAKGRSFVDYHDVAIKRPPVKMSREYRHLFGVQFAEIARKKSPPGSGDGALNELVSGDEIVRVKGIFISEDVRYAVISILEKKKRRHESEGKKVSIGDKIKGYSLVSILPGSIVLLDSAANKIVLKIFKSL